MRLIDADHLLEEIAKLKESPWFNEGRLKIEPMVYSPHALYVARREAVEIIEDLCIDKEPTVKTSDNIRWIECKKCGCNFQNYVGIVDGFHNVHKIKETKCPMCKTEVE